MFDGTLGNYFAHQSADCIEMHMQNWHNGNVLKALIHIHVECNRARAASLIVVHLNCARPYCCTRSEAKGFTANFPSLADSTKPCHCCKINKGTN